jgi:6-phosphogluconolactonase
MNEQAGAAYVQTNDADDNEVVAYRRSADGVLQRRGSFGTGGRGNGMPHLPSQSSIVLSGDGGWLLVTNAGSDRVSLFAVEADGLRLADRAPSGGSGPASVAIHDDLVYVLSNGSVNISEFRVADGKLTPLEGSSPPLSALEADGAQVSFSRDGRTLVVTERGTNSISSYAVDERGYADGPATIASAGATPYGFDFTACGTVVVTEAFGGEIGKAAASSYSVTAPGRLAPVSGSAGDTRSEVCWAAATRDGRFVYVTNFGDGTISSYSVAADGSLTLLEPVAASTRLGRARDPRRGAHRRRLLLVRDRRRRAARPRLEGRRRRPAPADRRVDGVPAIVAGLAAS